MVQLLRAPAGLADGVWLIVLQPLAEEVQQLPLEVAAQEPWVVAGVDAIQRGEPPANPTRILQASIAADNKPVPAMPAAPTADADISIDDLNAPLGN